MTSTIKVNNIQNQCGANIINENSNTITIGASGDTIALASGASQTGFGRTGTVDWQTGSIKTATFTAVNGQGFFCDTNGGAFTCNLPAGSAGAIVSLQDYRNTFDSNGLTVTPNGSEKINGGEGPVVLTTEGEGITLVYIDSTVGWRSIQDNVFADEGSNFIVASGGTVTESGNFRIHTFTGPGTFTVSNTAASAPNNVVDYLVVAGGGGGHGKTPGTSDNASGGGAGGFRYFLNTTCAPTACAPGAPRNGYGSPTPSGTAVTVTATAFPITVGSGGAGNPGNSDGAPGANSIFSTITSAAGGGGSSGTGLAGGSAGGAGRGSTIGTGNSPPVTPPQGSNSGTGAPTSGDDAGSGGGAMAVGSPTGSNAGSAGGAGAGLPTAFGSNGEPCGSFRYYAGGGGGGVSRVDSAPTVAGGIGGGGNGGRPGAPNTAGTDNTGGGGGGALKNIAQAGGNGGSGIVVIRYKFQ